MSVPLAYSVPEFLKEAKMGRTRFYQEVNSGKIVVRKNGTRTIILGPDAQAYLEGLPTYTAAKVR